MDWWRNNVYLALDIDNPTETQIQCLGSRVMEWGPRTWVSDISPFIPYWQGVAARQKIPIFMLWKKVLADALQELIQPNGFSIPTIRAVWDPSPFKAILMVSHMKQRNQLGWIMPGGMQHSSLWNGISWNTWHREITTLLSHWNTHLPKGMNLPKLNQNLKRLRLTGERLRLSPARIETLPLDGLSRRYGPWVTQICEWLRSSPTLSHFPWKTWKLMTLPSSTRFLDTPTQHWAELTQELIDDFDQLAQQLHLKVIELNWTIRFETNESVELPIRFRVPHWMAGERGHHKTLLIQCQGTFSAFATSLKRRSIPNITGWTVEITHTISKGIDRLTLFEFNPDSEQEKQLETLANQVLSPITRYHLCPKWTPEHEFSSGIGPKPTSPTPDETISHLTEKCGVTRPLFTLSRPLMLPPQHGTPTEATMTDWWTAANHNSERHYSMYQDHRGRWLWGYPDDQKIHIQGIYA